MHYLILGANAAGLSAAMRILKFEKQAKRQAKITVLEKSDVVSFGSCGIPYYVAGEFDDICQMTAKPLDELNKLGMDVRLFHTVIAIHPDYKTVTVQVAASASSPYQTLEFGYDKLLIATGASPSMPVIKGLVTAAETTHRIHTMHSKQDAQAILTLLPSCQHVVIIGAGFIGVEAAEAFSEQGKNVTMIEFADRILARMYDQEITCHMEDALKRHGVQLQLNERVTEIRHHHETLHYVVTDKGEYPADLVIVATGFKPNTDFLRHTAIHLSTEGAVVIDDQCKTNLPDIYAAGDCATVPHKISGNAYLPLATTANKLGRIAGEVMVDQANKSRHFIGTLGSSGIRVFDVEAGRTGITETEAKQFGIGYGTVVMQDKNHADYVPGQTDMWVKLIYDHHSRKLLGGQICGSYRGGAVHRTDALAVAVYSGLTVEELGFMDFIYAPPFSRAWEILNIAGNLAK